MAHFICEITLRLRDAGLVQGSEYPFPLTQADIADALGISVVHVNRIVQRLRGEGLLALSKGAIAITNQQALYDAAEFDSSYLRCDVARG